MRHVKPNDRLPIVRRSKGKIDLGLACVSDHGTSSFALRCGLSIDFSNPCFMGVVLYIRRQAQFVALFAIHPTKTPSAVKCENPQEKKSDPLSPSNRQVGNLGGAEATERLRASATCASCGRIHRMAASKHHSRAVRDGIRA
jgi:hypothetical protein